MATNLDKKAAQKLPRPEPLPRPGDSAPGPKRKRRTGKPLTLTDLHALGAEVIDVPPPGGEDA